MSHKTIYLKSANEVALKAELKIIFPQWDEQSLDIPTNGACHGVYLGLREGFYLANLLVHDDYDNPALDGMITFPVTPIHTF